MNRSRRQSSIEELRRAIEKCIHPHARALLEFILSIRLKEEGKNAGPLSPEEKATLFSAQSALVSSVSAMKALGDSVRSRDLSLAITNAETALLWLNQAARVLRADPE